MTLVHCTSSYVVLFASEATYRYLLSEKYGEQDLDGI